MKKLLVAVTVALSVHFSYAQSEQEYINVVKDALKIELKEHIYGQLNLSPTEEKAFDPLFNQYLKEQGKVSVQKWENFDGYLTLKDQYSVEKLDELNAGIWKANSQQVKLNKKYYKKFKKAIGVEKTTYFFFMKRYLDNAVEHRKLELIAR